MRADEAAHALPLASLMDHAIRRWSIRSGLAIASALSACAHHGPTPGAGASIDTVFVVPGSHLDVGFTAPISVVRSQRIAFLDTAIVLAERDPRFVWFEEGGWVAEAWLDHYHNDTAQIARLRRLVMQGRIGIGATMLTSYAAAFPMALSLLTQHLDRVEHELGRRPTVAVVNDVPAVPDTLIDVLAAAGIRYLMMGRNLSFTPPLPDSLARDAFFWKTPHGRVLVSIDQHGYADGLLRWLLPPTCLRAADPRELPPTISDDSILTLGVATRLMEQTTTQPLLLIQHAYDNFNPGCASGLPAAAVQWNQRASTHDTPPLNAKLVVALPDSYFVHLAARDSARIAQRSGEWGGDWGLLRASEPVWSWRLRQALARIDSQSPHVLQMAGATVIDHNVGLGPRWQAGTPAGLAQQHLTEVLQLYTQVVSDALGTAALASHPAAIAAPTGSGARLPRAWQQMLGDSTGATRSVARVRAGKAFLYPFVPSDAPAVGSPVGVRADTARLLVHTAIDRIALERRFGSRYQAVIDITLRAPPRAVTLVPLNSPAVDGKWLMGTPWRRVISPSGVRVSGPGWAFDASGPLLIGWSLQPDLHDGSITHLQALAVIHAVEGAVDSGRVLRLPFRQMYPGEPAVPEFDLMLTRR